MDPNITEWSEDPTVSLGNASQESQDIRILATTYMMYKVGKC